MTIIERHNLLLRSMVILLVGGLGSIVLSFMIGLTPKPDLMREALATLVKAIGLAATGYLFWRVMRPLAGDKRRSRNIGILTFFAFYNPNWLPLLPLDGHHATITARTAMVCVAFILAWSAYAWARALDAREAEVDATDRGAST